MRYTVIYKKRKDICYEFVKAVRDYFICFCGAVAAYLFWDSTTRTALAMFSALTGFLGFAVACRAYDEK